MADEDSNFSTCRNQHQVQTQENEFLTILASNAMDMPVCFCMRMVWRDAMIECLNGVVA